MSQGKPQKDHTLECPRCGFVLPLVIPLPAWCPLCDEDNPSQLRERRESKPKKTSGVAA